MFPGQMRYVIPPACSGSALGSPTSWTCLEHLQRKAHRKHPDQMPELPQLPPIDTKDNTRITAATAPIHLSLGDLRIVSLLFADDVVSSDRDLQHALGWFAAECEVVGMRVSTSKTEAMVLCWKTVDCFLWVGSEVLPKRRSSSISRSCSSEGKTEREMDRHSTMFTVKLC